MSGKSLMHGQGESYHGVVPTKQPNKSGEPLAEVAEGRSLTEENTSQSNPYRTPSRESGTSGLEHVRETARKIGKLKFTALLHHVTVELPRESYQGLKRQAAPGVDGVTWEEYGEGLKDRLADLHGRIHRGAYRAQPSRRIWIRKPNWLVKFVEHRIGDRRITRLIQKWLKADVDSLTRIGTKSRSGQVTASARQISEFVPGGRTRRRAT